MPKPLWAPWRLEYIKQADELSGCVFCSEGAGELPEDESLLVHRGESALVLLNKYPYSSGHLMTAPIRHAGVFGELTDAEALELHRLAAAALDALGRIYGPDGFNLGWNLGRPAGAGIADHVHLHVVPRLERVHTASARTQRRTTVRGEPPRTAARSARRVRSSPCAAEGRSTSTPTRTPAGASAAITSPGRMRGRPRAVGPRHPASAAAVARARGRSARTRRSR